VQVFHCHTCLTQVGATTMSSNEALKAGLRGKALRITHYFKDSLWQVQRLDLNSLVSLAFLKLTLLDFIAGILLMVAMFQMKDFMRTLLLKIVIMLHRLNLLILLKIM